MSTPLLDRLEIIQLSGYTLDEKRHIAQVLQATPYMHQLSIHSAKIPTGDKLSSSNAFKGDMSSLMTQNQKLCGLSFQAEPENCC